MLTRDIEREIHQAIIFMLHCHFGQLDKQGIPYFYHPLRVGVSLRNEGVDCEIAGYLHDVVEDCQVSLEKIRDLFGEKIAGIVDDVSRKKDETYAQFIKRSGSDPYSRVVKIADIKDNLTRINGLNQKEAEFLYRRYLKALSVLEGLAEEGTILE